MKINLRTEGLEGDQLSFVKALNERFKDIEFPDGNQVQTEVRAALKGFLDEEGKLKFDAEKLSELLSDGDSGVRTILKKQGAALKALQERGGEPEKRDFKSILQKRMDDVEKVFNRQSGEVRMSLRAPAIMDLDNTISGHDTLPDDLIESFSIGSFVEKRRPREYVFDIANTTTVAQIEQYKTWLEEGDNEGAFAIVEEGALKPLVSLALVRNHSEYKKVAAKYVVTEEFSKFRRNAYNIIQRLIQQKLIREYATILTTDLIADAAAYVSSALDDQYPASLVTDYHAIGAVAAQIEALDFMPDVLIMNPQDKWRIGLSQDTEGQFYLTIPITDPSGQTRMMGFLLRTSNKMPVGNFMLGESGLWEIEQESLQIRMGYGIEFTKDGTDTNVIDVQSDFDHNRFRVVVENFFHNYIATNNTGSFVYADFDTVKAAVTAP